ncbi:unnamed protein product [Rhodiola kirilowii]
MAPNPMKPVTHLDIDRYMGRWYEIAKYPPRFQPKDGVNTRANYALNEDGTVKIVNETWVDGKRRFIEGNAYKVDSESEEVKLKVKFYVPPFLPVIPVVGDYWVLYIDEEYRYALVGQPSRKYLWILCRENNMDDEIYNKMLEKATEEGYDVSKLEKTVHTNPPPKSEEGPKDTKGIWFFSSLFGK